MFEQYLNYNYFMLLHYIPIDVGDVPSKVSHGGTGRRFSMPCCNHEGQHKQPQSNRSDQEPQEVSGYYRIIKTKVHRSA